MTNSQSPYRNASSSPPPDWRLRTSAAQLVERGIAHGAGGGDRRPPDRRMQPTREPAANRHAPVRAGGPGDDDAAGRHQGESQPPGRAGRQAPRQIEASQNQDRQRPRHRIDGTQVAGAVPQGEPQEVDRLRATGAQQKRPDVAQEAGGEQLGRHRDQETGHADRRQYLQDRRPRVAALLGDQVPAGVQDRREQDDADGERRQALAHGHVRERRRSPPLRVGPADAPFHACHAGSLYFRPRGAAPSAPPRSRQTTHR